MRQVTSGKRSRGRPGRNRPTNNRNQTFDSSGPEGKVRGTAHQVYEKYLALARDAQSSGDRVGAENFFQHAEHYFRILTANGQFQRPRPHMNGFGDEAGDGDGDAAGAGAGAGAEARQAPMIPDEQPDIPDDPQTPAELAQAAAAKDEAEEQPAASRRRPRRRGPRGDNDPAGEAA